MAILIAQRFWDAGMYPMGVYTFGSPRVGDEQFKLSYQPKLYRIENRCDLVPHLPFLGDIEESLQGKEREQLGDFAVAAEYVAAGVCRWISTDGELCKPTVFNYGRQLFSVITRCLRWVEDHKLLNYRAGLEACAPQRMSGTKIS
jgi:hypothetical protein